MAEDLFRRARTAMIGGGSERDIRLVGEATVQHSAEPDVTTTLDGEVARITVDGELSEAARRPLVRVLTDLLLEQPALTRVELDVRAVSFMNSAGMAVLVQGQRMAAPRGIDIVLIDPPAAVSRPLQLSGLWHRFGVEGGPAS